MSAEGIEYHPPVGTHNKKILLLEDFDERGGDRISSPLRGRTTKKSSCWRISMSAEGIEYHPPCGDAQQKNPPVGGFR